MPQELFLELPGEEDQSSAADIIETNGLAIRSLESEVRYACRLRECVQHPGHLDSRLDLFADIVLTSDNVYRRG